MLRSVALCIGDLVEVVDLEPLSGDETYVLYDEDDEKRMVVLRFKNMKRIKPFPFKGKQGVGFLSKEDEAKIEYL